MEAGSLCLCFKTLEFHNAFALLAITILQGIFHISYVKTSIKMIKSSDNWRQATRVFVSGTLEFNNPFALLQLQYCRAIR